MSRNTIGLTIEPCRPLQICDTPGCREKRAYKLQRSRGGCIYLCGDCIREIAKYAQENEEMLDVYEQTGNETSGTKADDVNATGEAEKAFEYLYTLKKPELDKIASDLGITFEFGATNKMRADLIKAKLQETLVLKNDNSIV